MSYKTCDVIIPIHNSWHLARPCIDSVLTRTRYPAYKLLLVDDGSDPVIAERMDQYAERYPDLITVLRNDRPRGFVRSCNRAMRHSQADYVVLLNSDTCVTPNWLEKMIACMESDSRIGVASPISNFCPHMRIEMLPGQDFLRMAHHLERAHQPLYPDIVTPEGFCFMISRRCLDTIGYFDEVFEFGYCEESDYSVRANYFGFRTVCVDNVYIYHRGRGTFGNEQRSERYNTNKKILFRRWHEKFPSEHDRFKASNPIAATRHQVEEAVARGGDAVAPLRDDCMHVLCILPTLSPYGGVVSVVNMLNHFIEMGHYVTLVSLSPIGNHPHNLYTEPVYFKNWSDIPDRLAGTYDVVIATSWETVPYAVRVAAKNRRSKCVYYVQDFEVRFYDEGDPRRDQVLRTYDMIPTKIVKTRHLQEVMLENGWTTHRIRPGINLDMFWPRAKPSVEPKRVLAMVRKGAKHRGYDLVLGTLERVAKARPDVEIILFGSANLTPDEIPFPCVNAGIVAPDKLADLYRKSDVFLEMSRNHGFGRTGVEAMACGTAVVLSDSGGIRDYARHEENSLIVPVGDVEAAAASVLRLLDDDGLRRRLAQAGLQTVASWSDRGAAEDFLQVIRSIER